MNRVRICTPCVHGGCLGWLLKTVALCRECGHVPCRICMEGNVGGARYYQGYVVATYVSPVMEQVGRDQETLSEQLSLAVKDKPGDRGMKQQDTKMFEEQDVKTENSTGSDGTVDLARELNWLICNVEKGRKRYYTCLI